MLNTPTPDSPKHCFARLKARELADEMEIRGLTEGEIAQVAGGQRGSCGPSNAATGDIEFDPHHGFHATDYDSD